MGCERQCVEHSDRSQTRTREPFPPLRRSPKGLPMAMVLVIDQQRKPCAPAHAGRARHLLNRGRAAVFRRYPFMIMLKASSVEEPQPLRVKIAPGSKTTGLAVVNDASGQVGWAAELTHRGQQVK